MRGGYFQRRSRRRSGRITRPQAPLVARAANLGIGITFCLAALALRAEAAPNVVVSLKPVHSLVANVMRGIGEPGLLLSGGASPHSYSLRPSGARALARADLIVWMGPALEGFAARPIESAARSSRVLTLLDAHELRRWPRRSGLPWSAAAGGAHDEHAEHGHDGAFDPHVWLSPQAASFIVEHVANVLAELDADNAPRYAANAARTRARIARLDEALNTRLAPIREVPYLVLHDAFQPFEQHYGLRAVGALRLQADRPLGARRLRDVRRIGRELQVRCLFGEPQLESALVHRLAEASELLVGTLDPLGVDTDAGPDAWFALMRANAASLRECLGAPNQPQ